MVRKQQLVYLFFPAIVSVLLISGCSGSKSDSSGARYGASGENTVVGYVILPDRDSTRLEGARIRTEPPSISELTRSDGRFTMKLGTGTYRLVAEHDAFLGRPGYLTLDVLPGDNGPFYIVMGMERTLEGPGERPDRADSAGRGKKRTG